jgi:hypothetical protein
MTNVLHIPHHTHIHICMYIYTYVYTHVCVQLSSMFVRKFGHLQASGKFVETLSGS